MTWVGSVSQTIHDREKGGHVGVWRNPPKAHDHVVLAGDCLIAVAPDSVVTIETVVPCMVADIS
jgi:hypothetical protein